MDEKEIELKTNIIKGLLNLPEKIKLEEEYLINLFSEVEEINKKIKETEKEVLLIVSSLKTVDDKDVFSSDVKRKAETKRRLSESVTYKTYVIDSFNKKKTYDLGLIKVSYLKRMFRSYESISRLNI